jgi:hypothetical protein
VIDEATSLLHCTLEELVSRICALLPDPPTPSPHVEETLAPEEISPIVPDPVELDSRPLPREPTLERIPPDEDPHPLVTVVAPLSFHEPVSMHPGCFHPTVLPAYFGRMIEHYVGRREPITLCVTLARWQGTTYPFLTTYDVIPGVDMLCLPIDKPRLPSVLPLDLWSWIYHSRKVVAPSPYPAPGVPWPSSYFVRVGPDGVPIRKSNEEIFMRYRHKLHQHQQMKNPRTKGRMEISWLYAMPLVEVDPAPMAL